MIASKTKTQLTTLGSETTVKPLLVPASAKHLVFVSAVANSDSAAASDCVYFIRLEGPGLPGGPESFLIGGSGGNVATGQQDSAAAQMLSLNAPVTVANEIQIFAEQAEGDTGTINVAVTVGFSDA